MVAYTHPAGMHGDASQTAVLLGIAKQAGNPSGPLPPCLVFCVDYIAVAIIYRRPKTVPPKQPKDPRSGSLEFYALREGRVRPNANYKFGHSSGSDVRGQNLQTGNPRRLIKIYGRRDQYDVILEAEREIKNSRWGERHRLWERPGDPREWFRVKSDKEVAWVIDGFIERARACRVPKLVFDPMRVSGAFQLDLFLPDPACGTGAFLMSQLPLRRRGIWDPDIEVIYGSPPYQHLDRQADVARSRS